ncbi:MAG: hypothetical protein QOI66_475 [Myxococcales bacterium]|nr:hypothetical protein [Myxococcales bacterium]
MSRIISILAVVLSLSISMGGAAAAADQPAAGVQKGGHHDWKNIEAHLKDHQKYPATKAELVDACAKLSDFSAEDKQWFADTLPEGTYNSPAEVTKALKKAGKK